MIQIKPCLHYGKIDVNKIQNSIYGDKIIIVSSKTVWEKSYLKYVFDTLDDHILVKVYTHVRPNAPFVDLQRIVDDNNTSKPSTIVAIGGGSVIDACKALSVAFNDNSIHDLFYKKAPLPDSSIPLVAIPTTAGTGAELSFGAIIYDDVNHVKGGLRGEVIQPNAVFIDAELYKTAPKKLMAEVGFDCLTHAIETYISIKSNGISRYQSIAAIKTVFNFLPEAVKGDVSAMQQMAVASAMMGINLAYSSTCLPHRIQYVIGPLSNTSHAQGLIALYKGWIQLIAKDKKQSSLKYLEYDLGGNIDLVEKIGLLKDELDLNYSLTTLGINENQIDKIAKDTTGSVKNDPIYKDKNTIIQILKQSI